MNRRLILIIALALLAFAFVAYGLYRLSTNDDPFAVMLATGALWH